MKSTACSKNRRKSRPPIMRHPNWPATSATATCNCRSSIRGSSRSPSNITAGAGTDLERARAMERRLRTDYAYTLEMPSQKSADPLADFLFTRRRGYCEYFASAMAVMLRSIGVPARIATGFQSGLYNPITGLWVIRASDAHAWVEAWIPGNGWTTFDPTPPDPNGPRGRSAGQNESLSRRRRHFLAGVGSGL